MNVLMFQGLIFWYCNTRIIIQTGSLILHVDIAGYWHHQIHKYFTLKKKYCKIIILIIVRLKYPAKCIQKLCTLFKYQKKLYRLVSYHTFPNINGGHRHYFMEGFLCVKLNYSYLYIYLIIVFTNIFIRLYLFYTSIWHRL